VRIFFITNLPLWSLAEGKGAPSFFNTIKMFVDRGHSVTLLTTEHDPKLGELGAKVDIVNIPPRNTTSNRLFGGFFRVVQKHYNYFKSQSDIIEYLDKFAVNADLLYAYEIGFVPGVVSFAKKTGKPCVSRFQGTILTDLVQPVSIFRKLRLYLQFYDHIKAMRASSDLTVMTDDGTKGDRVLKYLRKGCLGEIRFFKNGVDSFRLDYVSQTYQKNHAHGDIVFSSVSRLQRWKRVDRSIEIFAKFNSRFNNSHYYIAGDGPEIENLKKLVCEKGLHRCVSFLGAQEKHQIYGLLKDTKYFLSSYELSNLGNPLFEAISCGAIVVTLDNGNTSEMIVDGVTGLLSDEHDFSKNAHKMIECENSPDLAAAMRAAAKDHLATNFDSWNQRMEREYDALKIFL
jgi:glycosyltransferase involved in cell wall biosynthesis